MPDSQRDELTAVTEQINSKRAQLDRYDWNTKLRETNGTITPTWVEQGQQLRRELNELLQRHQTLVLNSINESLINLAVATKNLKESSDSQVNTTKRLLSSSLNLETWTLILIVVAVANIFVVIAEASGVTWTKEALDGIAIILVVLVMAAILYNRIVAKERKSLGNIQ